MKPLQQEAVGKLWGRSFYFAGILVIVLYLLGFIFWTSGCTNSLFRLSNRGQLSISTMVVHRIPPLSISAFHAPKPPLLLFKI